MVLGAMGNGVQQCECDAVQCCFGVTATGGSAGYSGDSERRRNLGETTAISNDVVMQLIDVRC